jgi:hypothetical protein
MAQYFAVGSADFKGLIAPEFPEFYVSLLE